MGVHRNGFEVLSMGSSVRTRLLTPSSGKSDGRPRDTFHKESLGAWASIVEKKISKQNDEESQGDILKIKRFREQRVWGKSPLIEGPGNWYLPTLVRLLDSLRQTKSYPHTLLNTIKTQMWILLPSVKGMTVFIKATKQFSKMSKRKCYKGNIWWGGGRCNSASRNDFTPTLRDGVSNGAEC